jgi:hypothetical protein
MKTEERSTLNLTGSAWTMTDLIRATMLTTPEQIRDHVFYLARGGKTLEEREGGCWTMREREARVFSPWWAVNQARCGGRTRLDMVALFSEAWDCAKVTIGESLPDRAFEAIQEMTEFPEVANEFEEVEWKQLILLCRQMQRLTGDGDWWLSSPTVARLFKLNTHSLAYTRMRYLVTRGVLGVTKPGNQRRANRYRYLHPLTG